MFETVYKKAILEKKLEDAGKLILNKIPKASERDQFLLEFILDWFEEHEFKKLSKYKTIKNKMLLAYLKMTGFDKGVIDELIRDACLSLLIFKVKKREKYDNAYIRSQVEKIQKIIPFSEDLLSDQAYDVVPGSDVADEKLFVKRKNYRESRKKLNIGNPTQTWLTKSIYFKPINLEGLIQCVDIAIADKKKVRAAGLRFSFSEVVQTDHAYIDLVDCYSYDNSKRDKHRKSILGLDQSPLICLKEFDSNKNLDAQLKKLEYVNVPAGMRIWQLNNILYPDYKKQKASDMRFGKKRIYNMGGTDLQTFVGAAMTSTHGNGGPKSTLVDMIESILLVTTKLINGKLKAVPVRLEPSNGVTDPLIHVNKNPTIELIQNDDLFYSALVSMGYFGIVYSVIISTLPMSSFHEEVFFHSGSAGGWKEGKKLIKSKAFEDELKSEKLFCNILLNPYKVQGQKELSLSIRKVKDLGKEVSKKEINGKSKKRRFLPKVVTSILKSKGISKQTNKVGSTAKLIDRAMKYLVDNDESKGGYTDIFYKAVPAGSGDFKDVGMAVEFAFPFKGITTVLDKISTHLNAQKIFINSPIAVRFIKPSSAYFAINYEKDGKNKAHDLWVAIEILKVRDITLTAAQNFKLLKEMQKFMFDLGGRPHWGLSFNLIGDLDIVRLKSLYPHTDKWLLAYQKFNPAQGTSKNAYRAFSNKLSKVFEAGLTS
ncbi:MAG: hypothetical protein ACI959_000939 [Limisphaerales bacterium]|jgi:hypothetical protein